MSIVPYYAGQAARYYPYMRTAWNAGQYLGSAYKKYRNYKRSLAYPIPRPIKLRRTKMSAGIHTFKRMITVPTTSAMAVRINTTASQWFAFENEFADLDIVTSYTPALTTMYDQYRINRVTIKMVPRYNMNQLTGGGIQTPRLVGIIDGDGSPVLTEDEMNQYPKVKRVRGAKTLTLSYKPKVLGTANGIDNIVTGKTSPWLDCNNINVKHYGAYVLAPVLVNQDDTAPTFSTALFFDTYIYFTFQCKGLR